MDMNKGLVKVFNVKWLKNTLKIFCVIVAFVLFNIFWALAIGEFEESVFTRFVVLMNGIVFGAFLYPIRRLQDVGVPTLETVEYLGSLPSNLGLFLIVVLALTYSGIIALVWCWYKNKKQVI